MIGNKLGNFCKMLSGIFILSSFIFTQFYTTSKCCQPPKGPVKIYRLPRPGFVKNLPEKSLPPFFYSNKAITPLFFLKKAFVPFFYSKKVFPLIFLGKNS